LLAALPTLLPAPSTACFTASTFECLLDEPFERDLLLVAPLLELPRALLLADLAADLAFAAFGFVVFDFEDFDDDLAADDLLAPGGLARFGADRFFAFVFA
jgi:hypothetical protein